MLNDNYPDFLRAAFVLNGLPAVGSRTFLKIFENLGENLGLVFSLPPDVLQSEFCIREDIAKAIVNWKVNFDSAGQVNAANAIGARFIAYFSDEYPQLLKKIVDPPIGLHCVGSEIKPRKFVAIVGTRSCSHYGEQLAFALARRLAECGHGTVSGLAAGIDTAAHLGTLAGGGHTVAVLGCGLDIQYPIRNLGLREKIAKTGTLISEFPFGRRADKQTFAIRNRIITGMADAVIVVETDICGGSILSANFANRQGKPLFAVPGRIGDKHSAGCNKLIRNGATLLENIDDIIDFLGSANYSNMSQMDLPMQDKSQHPELDGNEKQIFEILSENPKSVEEIAFAAHIDTVKCSCVLQSLRVKGLAKKEISGEFTRKI